MAKAKVHDLHGSPIDAWLDFYFYFVAKRMWSIGCKL